MLRLRTFGGLAIESDGRPVSGAATQRRRLALLALLGAAAPRGVSRDKVFGMLWPESDTERAGNILSQALFAFRRAYGHGTVIAPPSTELRLNLDVISCDLPEFNAALLRGDTECAVNLYGGPFLDGFYLSEAPEFERWVTSERSRLARRHADALESLASAASARGDLTAAISWWRRLAAVDRTNSRVALALMNALALRGDHAGALQYARLHEILLREELGIQPDETVVALVERLKTARGQHAADISIAAAATQPPFSGSPPGPQGRPAAVTAESREATVASIAAQLRAVAAGLSDAEVVRVIGEMFDARRSGAPARD